MFTGIVEEIGSIQSIQTSGASQLLTIQAKKILEDIKLGDSIAVNGICLTVTSFTSKSFTVDVMPETFRSTGLRRLAPSSRVNLERAMAAGGRYGGHYVTGHVDDVGIIKSKKAVENAIYYEIETSRKVLSYVLLKGSVAVDGTSLTVFGVTPSRFTISLIPHTASQTILGEKGTGDIVSIECDMIGKYVEHFVKQQKNEGGISKGLLENAGFL
ncbi:riboflavin synthase [Heyndrickxia acidicola]|uniref:Riboflavin synthase n=1 Tax=Heyndrickxia acidicola TaxID=209389 RepID=A0ABU6MC83_9BACI|nr:riboflavin synthase [Heyndrickxia acidicola]MED1201621.1 riboflavin synthase [Heyndrickxia acidicola]